MKTYMVNMKTLSRQISYHLAITSVSNIPPSNKASCPALHAPSSFHFTQVFLATDECSDLFLNYYAAMAKSVSTQLLQVCHLTSPEEYFCFPKLVFIIILKCKKKHFYLQKHTFTLRTSNSNQSYLLQELKG